MKAFDINKVAKEISSSSISSCSSSSSEVYFCVFINFSLEVVYCLFVFFFSSSSI